MIGQITCQSISLRTVNWELLFGNILESQLLFSHNNIVKTTIDPIVFNCTEINTPRCSSE